MGVDSLGNARAGVTENFLCGNFVCTGIIKPSRQRMTAFVRSVFTTRFLHYLVEYVTKLVVGELVAVNIGDECLALALHPKSEVWESLLADGNGSVFTGFGLAFTDHKVTLFELHVLFED